MKKLMKKAEALMELGALLEDLTVAKARAGVEKLVHLTPQTARVVAGGRGSVIPAEKVEAGDIIRVLPEETVPVDGVLLSGQTSVNRAVMTGESLPVDKTAGDEVSSGTSNLFGTFEMRATKVYGYAAAAEQMSEHPLSKRMMTTIKCNLAFSMRLNFLAIALAMTGLLGPVVGALVHNAGSVLVIINSALLLGWKKRKTKGPAGGMC